MKSFWTLFSLGCLLLLVGCASTSPSSQNGDHASPLAGNWQFSMAAPSDGSFLGGLQGGFLLRNGNNVTGSSVYAMWVQSSQFCSSGSATITGTIDGQNVKLTAVAGGQTYTLNGTLSTDGSTMMGTYALSADSSVAPGAKPCGTAQTGLQWSAHAVPPLTGDVQGFFHSTNTNSNSGNQAFPITGILTQGDNIGTSSAMVTGNLTFSGFSCLGSSSHQSVNVTGQISGNSVILQIIADNGLNVGQIGRPSTPADLSGRQPSLNLSPVFFESLASGGNVLHGTSGYAVTTKTCPGTPGDSGNLCLALGNAKDCIRPLSLSPGAVQFPPRQVGSDPVSQTVTLTNTDPAGSTLKGLSLSLSLRPNSFGTPSDFNGLPSFTMVDTCSGSPGSTFDLAPQQSCLISVSFSPQQSCTWMPADSFISHATFVSPAQCPPNLRATVSTPPALGAVLSVKTPNSSSADSNTTFAVPISGIGISAIVPSPPELDFGAQAVSEASTPQTASFANQGTQPVQILPAAITPCAGPVTVAQPVQSGQIDGLRVVLGGNSSNPLTTAFSGGRNSVSYSCDIDVVSGLPNFQISSDTCSGKLLAVGESCTLNITYVAQPATDTSTGLDYFLQLNTQQCDSNSTQPYCEIDSGRFPVELRANPKSPLRMFPAAGLNFGTQSRGTPSTPLTIKLSNDATDPNSATIQLKGNLTSGDYTETDDCGGTLAPGGSCTLSIVFTPQTTGFDPGTVTITYLIPGSTALPGARTQTVYLRGSGQ